MWLYFLYNLLPNRIKNFLLAVLFFYSRRKHLRHFSRFVNKGSLVFDIGANVGHLTDIFLKLEAQVVCLEPQPDSVEILKRKYKKNPQVTIINQGAADKAGKLTFFISTQSPANSTFSPAWVNHPRIKDRKWDREIKVRVTTLDNLIKKYGLPDFCKIDVEGFEVQVIKGLTQKLPAISFEFDEEFPQNLKSCIIKLDSLGKARYNYSLNYNYRLEKESWITAEQLIQELKRMWNGYLRGDIYVRFI